MSSLRQLIQSKGTVWAAGAFDVLSARLIQEALHQVGRADHFHAQDLDGEAPVDHPVTRRVDNTHSALTDAALDGVALVYRLADVGVGVGRGAPSVG